MGRFKNDEIIQRYLKCIAIKIPLFISAFIQSALPHGEEKKMATQSTA
jgi:hypothetical protein